MSVEQQEELSRYKKYYNQNPPDAERKKIKLSDIEFDEENLKNYCRGKQEKRDCVITIMMTILMLLMMKPTFNMITTMTVSIARAKAMMKKLQPRKKRQEKKVTKTPSYRRRQERQTTNE